MASSGDERQTAILERVEAKLDRLREDHGERLAGIERGMDRLADVMLQFGAKLDTLAAKLDLDVQRLEKRIDLLRVELTNDAESFAKFESAGRADRLQEQLDELARRVESIEAALARDA